MLLTITLDDGTTRHLVVRSTQGFASQSSRVQLVPTGDGGAAAVDVAWPSGATSTVEVRAGELVTLSEDGSVEREPRGAGDDPERDP